MGSLFKRTSTPAPGLDVLAVPANEPIDLSDVRSGRRPEMRIVGRDSIELIASPFHSFRTVGQFQDVVMTLPCVRAAKPRMLQNGTLRLRVDCTNIRELIDELRVACVSPFQILSSDGLALEITLDDAAALHGRTESRA